MKRPGARLLATASALASVTWPALAAACPQCASRAEGGIAPYLALGVFVTIPFAVVAVVLRFVKRGDGLDQLRGPLSLGPAGDASGARRNDAAFGGTTPSRRPLS